MNTSNSISHSRKLAAWLIHLFTASGAVFGFLTLNAIFHHQYITAFWFMGITIFIDAVDGAMARAIGVKQAAPQIDGALLDNIVDYLNYVITPAFFLIVSHLLPHGWNVFAACAVVLASAYQFTQADAKTADHFFRGFPCYWNLAVFYLYIAQLTPWFNLAVIILLVVAIFVPIKYLYLSRIEYVSQSRLLRRLLMLATLIYAAATIWMLAIFPASNEILMVISWLFAGLYLMVSLYRTFVPLV